MVVLDLMLRGCIVPALVRHFRLCYAGLAVVVTATIPDLGKLMA